MSKQSTQDEDLIILSEDTDTHDTLEDLTLDFSDTAEDTDIITFGDEDITLELDDKSDAVENDAAEEEIILNLDSEESSQQVETQDASAESLEDEANNTSDIEFSLDLSSEEATQEETVEIEKEAPESLDLDL